MRSKAEALAKPIEGDKWHVIGDDWPWCDPTVLAITEDGEIRMRYEDGTSTWMTYMGFRAVMKNAEYLGGANE